MPTDQQYIFQCFHLALKGTGHVSPNPLVGCVIVKNHEVISTGYHKKFGGAHAEIEALKKLKFKAHGATLYCNLEPCCHYGKTPPCVHKIIQSGISRVVISNQDPNPYVSGQSIKLLKKKGIQVTTGVLQKEGEFLNRIFFTWQKKKRPYVILKVAMSLDGKIARGSWTADRRSQKQEWITSPKARKRVHQLRSQIDALLVGANTIRLDNPRLNVRGIRGVKQPYRIILGRRSRIPKNSKIFSVKGGKVMFVGAKHHVGAKIFLPLLAKQQISSLLVEGGAKVYQSFLKSGLVDELIIFQAPKILGGGGLEAFKEGILQKISLKLYHIAYHGPDVEMRFLKI